MNASSAQHVIPARWQIALVVVLLLWSSAAAAISSCPCPAQAPIQETPTPSSSASETDCHPTSKAADATSRSDAAQADRCCAVPALTSTRTRIDDSPKGPPQGPSDDTFEQPIVIEVTWPMRLTSRQVQLTQHPPYLHPGVPTHLLNCCFRQ